MLQNSLAGGWYINDFHRRNSMAAQREVMQMSLHPWGGHANVIASLLAGAEVGTDSQSSPALSDYQRERKCGAKQEIAIEEWAKATGLLLLLF